MVRSNQTSGMAQRRSNPSLIRHRKRRACFFVGGLVIILLIFGIKLHSTQVQLAETDQQIQKSNQELKEAQQRQSDLKLGVKRLNDENYLEQLIRDKYYYTKPGEKVYILPGDAAKDVTQN